MPRATLDAGKLNLDALRKADRPRCASGVPARERAHLDVPMRSGDALRNSVHEAEVRADRRSFAASESSHTLSRPASAWLLRMMPESSLRAPHGWAT